jgi:ribonuclease HI
MMADIEISTCNQSILLIEVYFDGLCQPINPGGIACYAFVVKRNGKTIYSDYGIAGEPFSKDSTNNVAEYTALAKALEWLVASNLVSDKVVINSDSQLEGNYKVKGKRIIPLYKQVLLLKAKFPDIEITWVPREKNREADRLTNIAYNKALQENPEYLDRAVKEGKG